MSGSQNCTGHCGGNAQQGRPGRGVRLKDSGNGRACTPEQPSSVTSVSCLLLCISTKENSQHGEFLPSSNSFVIRVFVKGPVSVTVLCASQGGLLADLTPGGARRQYGTAGYMRAPPGFWLLRRSDHFASTALPHPCKDDLVYRAVVSRMAGLDHFVSARLGGFPYVRHAN